MTAANERIASARLIVQKLKSLEDARTRIIDGLKDLEELYKQDQQPDYELREIEECRIVARHALAWIGLSSTRWEGYLDARRRTNNY